MENELESKINYSALSAPYYSGNNTLRSKKSRFESKGIFRQGFSCYDVKHGNVIAGEGSKWDRANCSGVPMDYDTARCKLYVDGSDSHTLLIGATGSKKSRLVVMPSVRTIAAAGEGMVICDPKGEIYQRTGAYLKKQGYHIYAINLREPQTGDGWNMLEVPYKHFLEGEIDKACELINDATISLMPVSFREPYWDYSARDMLFGLILLLFYISKEKNQPPEIVNMMSVLKLREELFCTSLTREIKNTTIWNYAKHYELVRLRLNGTVCCPERTLSCIVSTFDQHMSCFMLQPQIMDMLSCSTFDLKELGFNKTAIFLIMPDEKTTYHKIITIFVKQIYELLIDSAFKNTDNNRFPVRVNFILDEFSSLPAISDFPQMISASRSRNIRFTLVVQSKHQLKQRYQEETETIISNCTNWLFLTSRETELLREISELAGTTGTNHERLISISWLQHLDKEKGECLIFSGRKYPYLATLPDIDVYDDSKYEILEMNLRKQVYFGDSYCKGDFFELLLSEQNEGRKSDSTEEDTSDDLSTELPSIKHFDTDRRLTEDGSEDDILDIQAALEAKFDELFGTLDDEDD